MILWMRMMRWDSNGVVSKGEELRSLYINIS